MHIAQIIAAIEAIAPLSGAADWDKSGWQVACTQTEITHIAVALDPTPTTVAAALEQGAQFLLTHHPLSLAPQLPKTLNAFHSVLKMLFTADAGLYAAHTSLDVQPDGPVGWLARDLGLLHPEILEPTGEQCGFGLVGNLPTPMSFAQLLDKLGARISLETAVVCGPMPNSFTRIAYCTGSGSSLLSEACAAQADIFITGDVKYHTALESEICLLDVGHHSLEEEMMRQMSQRLARQLDLTVTFIPSRSPLRRAAAI